MKSFASDILTIVPDLHADPIRLKRSLSVNEGSKTAFLGDFIDAGKGVEVADDEAVLCKVKRLVDAGKAIAVMGNHELNAILFHRMDSAGRPLRQHAKKNLDQHRSFIDRFGVATDEARYWSDWFLDLPLWFEDSSFRLVHACWDQNAIDTVRARRSDGRLKPEDLEEVAVRKTDFAKAVERLTSGPEVQLPNGFTFMDIKNNERSHVRLKWWGIDGGGTWRSLALSVPDKDKLPDSVIDAGGCIPSYGSNERPVFVGHYKRKGAPKLEVKNALCLDYPETPCVYSFEGEKSLKNENIISV